jgi:hypothetical protein
MTSTKSIRQADGASDRKWVILCEDGQKATLGRARDPSDDEVAQAEASMVREGLAGWLAIQSHSVQRGGPPPTYIEVRPLGSPTVSFDDAVAATRALVP